MKSLGEGVGCVWEPCGQDNEKKHNMDALSGRL